MSHSTPLAGTEEFLHEQIPITRAMGVRVASYEAGELVLTAPLNLNHNHLGTAFGGSLSAIATLAGYSLLWLALDDRGAHIVIRESTIKYRRAVRGEIRARCRLPEAFVAADFREELSRLGKARLRLRVSIDDEIGGVAVEFTGVFVATK